METASAHESPGPVFPIDATDLGRLDDEELLALVLDRSPGVAESGPRVAEKDVLALVPPRSARLARELFSVHGPLRRLSTRSVAELCSAAPLDPREASRLRAVFELGRRMMDARLAAGAPFLSPRQIFDHYHGRLRDRKRETFLVVLLDARHRILREEAVSEGSLTSSIVHPREVFCAAVRESAGAVVLVHNHPSGDPAPSEEDVAVTRRLVQASELIGIRVLDHVIVGDGCYTSFKEAGLL